MLYTIYNFNILSQFSSYKIYKPVYHFLKYSGFPSGSVVRSLPANTGDMGSIPGQRWSHKPQSE